MAGPRHDTALSNTAHYTRLENIALIVLDHPPVNALGRPLRAAICGGLEAAQADPLVQAVVLMGSENVFSAGADIKERNVDLARNREEAKVPDRLDKLIIAAIGGSALGGGLELALCCHYRIAAGNARLGLSEVKLGRLPGTGGTQRLPRLIGVAAACNLLLGGEPVDAQRALQLGLIDRIATGPLRDAALAYTQALLASGAPLRRIRDLPVQLPDAGFLGRQRARLQQLAPGYEAPLRVLDCIEAAATLPFDQAKAVEESQGDAARISLEARGLQLLFFAERLAQWPDGLPQGWRPRPVSRIGLAGSSDLLDQVAALSARHGLRVQAVTAAGDAGDCDLVLRSAPDAGLASAAVPGPTFDKPCALLQCGWNAAAAGAAAGRFEPVICILPSLQSPDFAEVSATADTPAGHLAIVAQLCKQLGIPAVLTLAGNPLAVARLRTAAVRSLQPLLSKGVPPAFCARALHDWGFRADWCMPAPLADRHSATTAAAAAREIIAMVLHALTLEGRALVTEGRLRRPSDVDVLCIAALGFPRHRGGPMFLADHAPEPPGSSGTPH